MEHDKLLNLSMDIGYHLMVSGASIYRVEDSISRLLLAYGLDSAEVFAIPHFLSVSISDEAGAPLTRTRRIPAHGTSIELLERYNALCRSLCSDTPGYDEAKARLDAVPDGHRPHSTATQIFGYFLGAWAFCLFFHGSMLDALFSGICGIAVGLCLMFMGRIGSNGFLRTMAASAISAGLALSFTHIWPQLSADLIIIGAFMALVPGVAFTTALRDIMAGDMLSGIVKLAEGIFIAVAIVLGTGFAMGLVTRLWG